MAKKYYLPESFSGKADWFENLAANIDDYSAKYGLTVSEVNYIKALALYFRFWYTQVTQLKNTIKNIVGFKDEILYGGGTSVTPADISFASMPPAVAHGALKKITSIVARIKKHELYTTTDGEELDIEGAEPEVEDMGTIKPLIKVRLKNSMPEVVWKKGETGAILIEVARNLAGGPVPPPPTPDMWEMLAIDTIPNYIDTHDRPPFGQSQVWGYRAQYMVNDLPVGEFSDPVYITVTG